MLTRPDHERLMREAQAQCDATIKYHSDAIDNLNRATDSGADLAIAVEVLKNLALGQMQMPSAECFEQYTKRVAAGALESMSRS